MRRFADQVAIVTGGANGIGAATARRLAGEGAAVVVADLDLDAAEQIAGVIQAEGGQAVAVQVEVAERDQVEAMLAAALAAYDRIDVLANIAGIARFEPFLDLSEETWRTMLDVNLTGVFLCSQVVENRIPLGCVIGYLCRRGAFLSRKWSESTFSRIQPQIPIPLLLQRRSTMAKVAIIGAGSIVFCKTLILDILAADGLEDTEFALMAPSTRRTPQVESFVNRVIEANDLPAKAWVTTDVRDAVRGADYVITTFQVGGLEGFESDYKIPLQFGVDQCIGDTLGPGGIFRALRSIPVMMDLAADMEELCPDAHLLQYVNPMAMLCWALGTTNVKFVGLCHGVQTTLDLISGYVDVPKQEIDFLCAGINHMGWFLELRHEGRDLYPTLRERFEDPAYYVNEKVRGEAFRHFGYFMTESTGHLSEYLPYFRKNQKALDLYCDEPGFGGESGAYYYWCESVGHKYNEQDILAGESPELPPRSVEYGSYVIEALEMGRTFKLNGNVTNGGMITNLPPDCCGEGPIYVDRTGLHKTVVGDLPPQCAALNMTNINVQRLAVEAALTGDVEHIMHACALDPLTAATLTLKETREMATAMLEAQRQWLPQFAGKEIRPTPTISIPANVVPAEVPIDPALAIMARFQELSK